MSERIDVLHARVDQTEAETRWNTYTLIVVACALVVFGLRTLFGRERAA